MFTVRTVTHLLDEPTINPYSGPSQNQHKRLRWTVFFVGQPARSCLKVEGKLRKRARKRTYGAIKTIHQSIDRSSGSFQQTTTLGKPENGRVVDRHASHIIVFCPFSGTVAQKEWEALEDDAMR